MKNRKLVAITLITFSLSFFGCAKDDSNSTKDMLIAQAISEGISVMPRPAAEQAAISLKVIDQVELSELPQAKSGAQGSLIDIFSNTAGVVMEAINVDLENVSEAGDGDLIEGAKTVVIDVDAADVSKVFVTDNSRTVEAYKDADGNWLANLDFGELDELSSLTTIVEHDDKSYSKKKMVVRTAPIPGSNELVRDGIGVMITEEFIRGLKDPIGKAANLVITDAHTVQRGDRNLHLEIEKNSLIELTPWYVDFLLAAMKTIGIDAKVNDGIDPSQNSQNIKPSLKVDATLNSLNRIINIPIGQVHEMPIVAIKLDEMFNDEDNNTALWVDAYSMVDAGSPKVAVMGVGLHTADYKIIEGLDPLTGETIRIGENTNFPDGVNIYDPANENHAGFTFTKPELLHESTSAVGVDISDAQLSRLLSSLLTKAKIEVPAVLFEKRIWTPFGWKTIKLGSTMTITVNEEGFHADFNEEEARLTVRDIQIDYTAFELGSINVSPSFSMDLAMGAEFIATEDGQIEILLNLLEDKSFVNIISGSPLLSGIIGGMDLLNDFWMQAVGIQDALPEGFVVGTDKGRISISADLNSLVDGLSFSNTKCAMSDGRFFLGTTLEGLSSVFNQ